MKKSVDLGWVFRNLLANWYSLLLYASFALIVEVIGGRQFSSQFTWGLVAGLLLMVAVDKIEIVK